MSIRPLQPQEQVEVWRDHALDDRGVIATAWVEVNEYLFRGGLTPGTLVIIGGRTQTRKTTVMLNMTIGLLMEGRAVGFVGLDEAPFSYVSKLASAMSGVPHAYLEEEWDTKLGREVRKQYLDVTQDMGRLVLSTGARPSLEDMSAFLEMAEVDDGGRVPEVLIVDYLSLLSREGYPFRDVERLPRLVEDLQVWTNENGAVLFLVHQVGRLEEGTTARYHGDKPMTAEHLKYGGEEIADIVLGTFRPAKDPLGNMTMDEAVTHLGERFDEDRYLAARRRVEKYQNSTFLQVLKNRPGTRTCERGIELISPNESMLMYPKGEDVRSG